jgi:hypothetical protein
MARRQPPKPPRMTNVQQGDGYVVVDDKTYASQINDAFQEYGSVQRTTAYYQDLSGLTTYLSGRPGLDRADYNRFRPQEAVPRDHHEIMVACNEVYNRVGIVRNVIDLMADFACQGIRISHPNKKIEKFYRNWFKKIQGSERSERFLNYLYRLGNVVVRVHMAKVSKPNRENLYRTHATPDITIKGRPPISNELPWKYTFLDPSMIQIVGGGLASFVGEKKYSITIPMSIAAIIKAPKTKEEKELVAQLPQDIINAAKQLYPYILPPEKTVVKYYKKDDWSDWAKPMIYAILSDIVMLEKLKLADSAALDGAISNIRIFKIGSLEHKIAPTRAAVAKLNESLQANVGGGTVDIIWGPDIELMESKTTVHQFLGDSKYVPHLNAIFAGLGIPPTLTGSSGSSGTTNNFISLKTLIQRLEYGRQILKEFWEDECAKVQQVMGFRLPPVIEFDIANLGDEIAEKTLLLNMVDRNIISEELLVNRVGADPDLERIRTNREDKERETNRRREKTSPYHDPQFGIALKKIALQSGAVTPTQVGLDTEEKCRHLKMEKKKKGELTTLEMRNKSQEQSPVKTGEGLKGRPKNSKDKEKRKEKTFKPKTKAMLEIWAKAAQSAIGEVLNDIILEKFGRKNFRSMTDKEVGLAEDLKFGVLFSLEPLGVVDEDIILAGISKEVPPQVQSMYNEWLGVLSEDLGRKLTIDECRHVQTCLFATIYGGEDQQDKDGE